MTKVWIEVVYLDIFISGSQSSGDGADTGNAVSEFKDTVGCIIV